MRKLTLTMIMMFIGLTAFSQFGIKGGGAFGVVTNTKILLMEVFTLEQLTILLMI